MLRAWTQRIARAAVAAGASRNGTIAGSRRRRKGRSHDYEIGTRLDGVNALSSIGSMAQEIGLSTATEVDVAVGRSL